MKNELKNKKGITLIALVITIIVLLILAGVSISMISSQDGILNKATTAKETQKKATTEEKTKLAIQEALIDGEGTIDLEDKTGTSKGSLYGALKKEFGENDDIVTNYNGDGEIKITSDNIIYVNQTGKISSTLETNEDSDTAIIERIIKSALNGRETFNINELKVEVEKYKGTVKGVKPIELIPTICQFPVTVTLGQTKFAVENNGNYWKIEEKDFVTPQKAEIMGGIEEGEVTIKNVENLIGWTLSEVMYNASLLGAKYDPTSGYTDEEWIDEITDNGDADESDEGLKYWPVKIYYDVIGDNTEDFEEELKYITTNKGNACKFNDYKMQYKMMSILLDDDYDMDGIVQIKFQSDELKKYSEEDILILTVDTDTGEIKYLELDSCNSQTRRIHSYI